MSSSSSWAFGRSSWNRQDSGSISPDDEDKVYDAIIVAAGIVAVLIANVAYVGESHTMTFCVAPLHPSVTNYHLGFMGLSHAF